MQYNIFQNDFYEEMPGLPWAYRIDVLVGDPPREIAKLGKAVKEVDLPDAELEFVEAFHAGMTFKIPTRYKNSASFNAIFNDDKNLTVYRELLKLFRHSYDNREQKMKSSIQNRVINNRYDNLFHQIGTRTFSGSEVTRKYSNQKEEIILRLYIIDPRKINYRDTQLMASMNSISEETIAGLTTNDPEIVAVYTFRDCFIENIDSVEFDYSSEECVEWPIKIHFNEMSVEYPHQDKIVIPEAERQFRSESLDIPDYKNLERSRYRADIDRHVETESEGKYAEMSETASQALARAYKAMEEIRREAASERTTAVNMAEKEADATGRLKDGNYTTAEAQWEAEKSDATLKAQERTEQMLEEKGYYKLRDEEGLDLLNMSDDEIRQRVTEISAERAIQGKFDIDAFATEKLFALREEIMDEAEKIRKKAVIETDIERRSVDNVEMNMTSSTNKYYGGTRSTQEGKTDTLNKRAAKAKLATAAINSMEVDFQEANQREAKNRKMFVENGTIDRAEFESNFDYNYKLMDNAKKKAQESMKSFDKVDNAYVRAQTQEEIAKRK